MWKRIWKLEKECYLEGYKKHTAHISQFAKGGVTRTSDCLICRELEEMTEHLWFFCPC
uniref:Reverse transcriptase zinc-binding domain-containing protein n=1 Tax=Rhizophora mucronata TaxID=61149 RepID=A0A2P2PR03_RHIMU